MNTFVAFKKYDYSFHFTMYQIIHVCLSICSLVTIVEMLFRSIYIQLQLIVLALHAIILFIYNIPPSDTMDTFSCSWAPFKAYTLE